MKIKYISSNRTYENSSFWHLVFEWEDQFAEALKLQFIHGSFLKKIQYKVSHLFVVCFQKIGLFKQYVRINELLLVFITALQIDRLLCIFFKTNDKILKFEMYPSRYLTVHTPNYIPYIIDFDLGVNLKHFNLAYRNSELILISGLEAFNYLKMNGCILNIVHLPLSISDKYQIGNLAFNKVYDIVIAGRKNTLLWEYMLRFEKKYPDVEYVYSSVINGNFFYVSNKTGIIGEFPDRLSYIALLTQSRIGFYSTPGIDEKATKFINHVTPRIFEYIYAGCLLVGRYPKNHEVEDFKISSVCDNVNSFEEFEALVLKHLQTDIKSIVGKYSAFLSSNYTSIRAQQLRAIEMSINETR